MSDPNNKYNDTFVDDCGVEHHIEWTKQILMIDMIDVQYEIVLGRDLDRPEHGLSCFMMPHSEQILNCRCN